MATTKRSAAARHALECPPGLIMWADSPRPRNRRRWYAVGAAGLILGVAIPAAARPELGAVPRLAPAGCVFHTVVPGDTVWAIAGEAGVTLDVIAQLNPGIPKLNRIFPNDQVATSCPANEMQQVKTQILDAVVLVNVDRYIQELERPGVASKRAVLAALFKAGARDEQLITLAALTEGESGRQLSALGDVDIQSGDWGPSRGVFQIRTLKSQTGKGTTRDINRVASLEGGAQSAVELWNQSQERGKAGGNPWTAYQKSWHVPFMETYKAVAAEMGLLS